MLKKTITFTDFNGVRRTEDHYFNLTKAEITELELSRSGGLSTVMNRIVQSRSTPEIAEAFKEILRKSYGKKSDDGRRFMKSDEIWRDFEETEAYSELFMELISDAGKMAEFFNGIAPAEIVAAVQKKQAEEAKTNASPDSSAA